MKTGKTLSRLDQYSIEILDLFAIAKQLKKIYKVGIVTLDEAEKLYLIKANKMRRKLGLKILKEKDITHVFKD